MKHYNPLKVPNPQEWLELDEQERIDLVRKYHRQKRIRLPNAEVHALFHVILEHQIAAGDALPTERTVQRLMSEGLDRHDAIHAVGTVISNYIFDAMQATPAPEMPADYFVQLQNLTAQNWLDSFS